MKNAKFGLSRVNKPIYENRFIRHGCVALEFEEREEEVGRKIDCVARIRATTQQTATRYGYNTAANRAKRLINLIANERKYNGNCI